jgi:hypothetical protein
MRKRRKIGRGLKCWIMSGGGKEDLFVLWILRGKKGNLFIFYVSYLNTLSVARLVKIEWMVDK